MQYVSIANELFCSFENEEPNYFNFNSSETVTVFLSSCQHCLKREWLLTLQLLTANTSL